jgi:glyceraldehyde-3-phosphate dehydrogenase (ferredoxin)
MTINLNQRELVIDLANSSYEINRILPSEPDGRPVIGPVDYGWLKYYSYMRASKDANLEVPPVMTWGGGPLAGSRIPGTRRLVFCGYSPIWEGFYISSLGGAAYVMHRVGVDFITVIGQALHDSVLILNHKNGQIEVRLEPINPDVIWTGYADQDGYALFGFFALQQAVYNRYANEYSNDWVRVFAVGPAARTTNQGIIGSSQIKQGRILPIEDWAGRGGLGSRLLQYHHIAACIFGGDWDDPDLKDSREIDGYFQKYYGDSMIRVDLGATEKYRYVPGFMTGGTFGVNMHHADDKLFSFNYTSVNHSSKERLAQHSNFILNHYLKQFNEEIIKTKNFAHCGEPCSVACKKYDRIYKKDYEPYEALGPLCGIFDQRAAEKLNHFIDALGIDAIQMGGTIAWIMELINDGILDPQEYGLPPASEFKFTFASEPDQFDVVSDSWRNAEYAIKIASLVVFEEAGGVFRNGIRYAAEQLNLKNHHDKEKPSDRAVFISHGGEGCMTPNQYWVPGMYAPMPVMGKYFVYYGLEYLPPRLLGQKCVERMVYELFSENTGVCRFHRKWVEAIVDEIIEAHYKFSTDYKAHQFELARQIFDLEGTKSSPWESERLIDIIGKYLEEWGKLITNEPSLNKWIQRFKRNKFKAANEYWNEIRLGILEAFDHGPANIPEIVAPYQAANQDVMSIKESH